MNDDPAAVDLAGALVGAAGVRRALCGPRGRGALHRALLDCLGEGGAVRARLHRSKLDPGRRLRAYYDVATGGHDPDRRQIAVTWSARPELAAADLIPTELLEAGLRGRGLTGPFTRLRFDDPAIGLQLLVAPLDPVFPQLARLYDPAYLRSRLGGHTVTAVRYRPGQRHVLRLDPRGRGDRLFVKVYRPGTPAAGPGTAARLWAAGTGMARLLNGLAPEPTLLVEDDAVAWPAAPGAPLSRLLRQDLQAGAARISGAGALLRRIHDTPPDRAPAGLPTGPRAQDELAAITRTARHIPVLLPPVGRRVTEVLARVGDRLAGLPGEPPTLVHGDYKADHLLAGPDRLSLIDLDRCAWGDPALDLAKFLADLRWWTRPAGRSGADALRARFLAGYGACPQERLARLHDLEPLLLVKMAARRPRLHDPRWARLTAALVAEADRLTGERAVPEAVA